MYARARARACVRVLRIRENTPPTAVKLSCCCCPLPPPPTPALCCLSSVPVYPCPLSFAFSTRILDALHPCTYTQARARAHTHTHTQICTLHSMVLDCIPVRTPESGEKATAIKPEASTLNTTQDSDLQVSSSSSSSSSSRKHSDLHCPFESLGHGLPQIVALCAVCAVCVCVCVCVCICVFQSVCVSGCPCMCPHVPPSLSHRLSMNNKIPPPPPLQMMTSDLYSNPFTICPNPASSWCPGAGAMPRGVLNP